jgi:hypothetical protein
MELTSSTIMLNGHEVSTERADKIMFVQCIVLKKKFRIDSSTYPVSVIIEGYFPDENDLLPEAEGGNVVRVDGGAEPDKTPVVKKCGKCNKKNGDEQQPG